MSKTNKIITGVLALGTLGSVASAQGTNKNTDSLLLQTPIQKAQLLHETSKRLLNKQTGPRLHVVNQKYAQKVLESVEPNHLKNDSIRYSFALNQNLYYINEQVYSFAPLAVQRETARRFTLTDKEKRALIDNASKKTPYNIGELVYNHSVLIAGPKIADNIREKMVDWVQASMRDNKNITNFEIMLSAHKQAMDYFVEVITDSTDLSNISQGILRGISSVYTTAWADLTGLNKETMLKDNLELANNISDYSSRLIGGIRQAEVFLNPQRDKDFLLENLKTVLMGIDEIRTCIIGTSTSDAQKGADEQGRKHLEPAIDYFNGLRLRDGAKLQILDNIEQDFTNISTMLNLAQSDAEIDSAKQMIIDYMHKIAKNRNIKDITSYDYLNAVAATKAISFGRLVVAHSNIAIDVDHYTKSYADPNPSKIFDDGSYIQSLYLENHIIFKNSSAGFNIDTLKKMVIERVLDANDGDVAIVDVYYDADSRHLIVLSMKSFLVDKKDFENLSATIYSFDNLLGTDFNTKAAAYMYLEPPKRLIIADKYTTEFVQETKDTIKVVEQTYPMTRQIYPKLSSKFNLPPRYFVNLREKSNPLPEQLITNAAMIFSDPTLAITRLQNGDYVGALDLVKDSAAYNKLVEESLGGEYVLSSKIFQPRVILNTGAQIGDVNINLLYAVYVSERTILNPIGASQQWNNSADPRDTDEFGVLGVNLGYSLDFGWFDRYKIQAGYQYYNSEDFGIHSNANIGIYAIGSAPLRFFGEYYNKVVSVGADAGLENARVFANGVNLLQMYNMPAMLESGVMFDIVNITAEIFGSDALSRQYVSSPVSLSSFYTPNTKSMNSVPIHLEAELRLAVPVSQKTALLFGLSYEKLLNTVNNHDLDAFYNMGSTRMDDSIYPGVGDRIQFTVGLRVE
jgi:hypothetical protein